MIFKPIGFSLILFCLFLLSYCMRKTIQLTISVNNNSSSLIVYELNSTTCNLLTNQNVTAQVRCLMLCQSILCKSLQFDMDTRNCTLYGGQPELIKYDSLPAMNLTYVLSEFLDFSQSCLFNFTCYPRLCLNGICCSFDHQK